MLNLLKKMSEKIKNGIEILANETVLSYWSKLYLACFDQQLQNCLT